MKKYCTMKIPFLKIFDLPIDKVGNIPYNSTNQ